MNKSKCRVKTAAQQLLLGNIKTLQIKLHSEVSIFRVTMTKRKNKHNGTDCRRTETAQIETHKGLNIVEGTFLVININKNQQSSKQTAKIGDKYLLERIPEVRNA
ncbi:hypothetical protein MFRU_003g02150 [Monilinia fructicola]|nr:hypothetical protein MFRU_003g02150 [Monilinia fructicola]